MWKFLFPFLLVGGGAFALSLGSFIEWSSFTAALFKISIGLGCYALYDRYLMPTIDTVTELKAGNVAVGLQLLSGAVIILGALIAS